MRKRQPPRVVGPYQERNQWRIVVVGNGRRQAVFLPTREEAERCKAETEKTLKAAAPRILADVLAEWTTEKLQAGTIKPVTVLQYSLLLQPFFGGYLQRDLARVTALRAAALYQEFVDSLSKTGRPRSVATQHHTLCIARKLYDHAVTKGYIRNNPFADIQRQGIANTGKPQLRIDEARLFIDIAIGYYEETKHPLAVGVLVALMMGMRTSEVLHRTVRDLDNGGRLLWIDAGKTKNARRHLEVPDVLRPYLLALATGKTPSDPLFGCGSTGKPRVRQTMWAMVQRMCERAGVPRVCTHSLRGLFATLAVQSGAVTHAVAASLGHGSFAMTQRHYAQPSAVANAATARVTGILETSTAATKELAALPAATLALLLRMAKGLTEPEPNPPTPS
jgi:integrase